MSKASTIHLGFEVGTGRAVAVPLGHLVCFGMTQQAGKTTALEALIERAGVRGLAFITKRGEGGFEHARRVEPYYSDAQDGRPYWQFVESIVATVMQESKKFERAWIVKACRGASSLAEVRANIPPLLAKAKRAMDQDIFMLLGEYLDIVIPQIAALPKAKSLTLGPGPNVMDLTAFSEEMQMLLVRSAVDWVHRHEQNVVTVIPEAWKFVPDQRMTPVKPAVERLIREGAGLGNFVWPDSQDAAGLWKLVQRPAKTWLIGVQREHNEVQRNLKNIPGTIAKPNAADVMQLELGQFYACWGTHAVKTYVQPAWMDEATARAIAMGRKSVGDVAAPFAPCTSFPSERHTAHVPKRRPQPAKVTPETKPDAEGEDEMSAAAEKKLDTLIELLTRQAASASPATIATTAVPAPSMNGDEEAMYQRFKSRLLTEPAVLKVLATQPEIEVQVERTTIEVDGKSLQGRLAQLIARGFLDEPKTQSAMRKELVRTGPDVNTGNLSTAVGNLLKLGFLTNEADGYEAVKGMKVRIIDKR